MSRKKHSEEIRCPRCRLHKDWCFCNELSTIKISNHITVFMHFSEYFHTSNTGNLIPLIINSGTVILRDPQKKDVQANFDRSLPQYMLFPDLNAIPVSEISGPINLIVPDGTWKQARKLRYRDPILSGIPTVSVSPMEPSRYYFRKQGREDGMSTFEAVAHALYYLEGEEVYKFLMSQFDIFIAAMQKARKGASVRDPEIP